MATSHRRPGSRSSLRTILTASIFAQAPKPASSARVVTAALAPAHPPKAICPQDTPCAQAATLGESPRELKSLAMAATPKVLDRQPLRVAKQTSSLYRGNSITRPTRVSTEWGPQVALASPATRTSKHQRPIPVCHCQPCRAAKRHVMTARRPSTQSAPPVLSAIRREATNVSS